MSMEESLLGRLQRDVPGEGANLYRHLGDLVGKCASLAAAGGGPASVEEAVQEIERLSLELKYERFRAQPGADRRKKIEEDPAVAEERVARRTNIVKVVQKAGNSGSLENAESYLKASSVLRLAGLGFSEDESYQIHLQVQSLAQKEDVDSARFWGKILGTNADYYIYEGTLAGAGTSSLNSGPLDENEPRGTGANKTTYWAQNHPLGKMTQLPNVTSSSIKAAKLISGKLLTGNLFAPVVAVPFFHGKEIDFLRAQIARITSSCKLHVSGYYTAVENPETGTTSLTETEDFVFPASADLAAQPAWVHSVDFLLNNGKTNYPPASALEDMEEGDKAVLDAEMEACPAIPALTTIDKDLEADEDGNSKAWRVKQAGEKSSYTFGDGSTKTYTVTVVSSTRWQGHYTVSQGSSCYNFYCGYGLKTGSTSVPVLIPYIGATQLGPGPVCTEGEVPEECPEPNPEEDEAASDGGEEDEAIDGE